MFVLSSSMLHFLKPFISFSGVAAFIFASQIMLDSLNVKIIHLVDAMRWEAHQSYAIFPSHHGKLFVVE